MLDWLGDSRSRAFIPCLSVIVFTQFDRLMVMVFMTMIVFMFMFVVVFRPLILLRPEDFPRYLYLSVHEDIHLRSRDSTSIDPRNLQPRSNIQRRHRVFEQL
jgi:hypothetical protein